MKVLSSRTLRRQGLALLSTAFGSTLVFSTVIYMNQQEKPPKEQASESSVAFQVERKPPPKKQRKERERSRAKQRKASANAPKAPELSSAISDVGFEFSGPSGIEVQGVSQELIGSFDKKAPMTEGALDKPPKVRARSGSQEYPPEARKKGLTGYVLLNIYVKDDGSVGTVKVLDAQPRGVFEESAKTFVEDWSFDPGTYEQQPVDAWVKQKVVYQLQRS